MAEPDFGNEQDISVHDKEHPTLGPTEEAQDVAQLERIVVPMPAFTDPNDPRAASGSVNFPLNDHPVEHSEDYGADVNPGVHDMQSTMTGEGSDANSGADLPEDRGEWKKADWQAHAKSLGIATSGNVETLRGRVEEHEASQEEFAAFEKEVKGASRDELDKMASEYDLDPTEYGNKDELAQAILDAAYSDQ